MNTILRFSLLITLLVLAAAGCGPQPPANAQAAFDVEFTLKTSMDSGRMIFVGVGGEIEAMTNPDMVVRQGDRVHIILINDDGMPHDLAIPDLSAQTTMITEKGQTTDLVFEISSAGEFTYYCTVSGHRQAGMEGKFIVSQQ